MSIQIKSKYLVLSTFLLICGIFFGGWYLGHSKVDRVSNALKTASDSIIHLKAKIRGDSVLIAVTTQAVATQKEALKQLDMQNKDLKELGIKQAHEITRLKFRIDTLLKVPHDGQVITVHDTVFKERNAILLPFSFSKKDKFFDLSGLFDEKGQLGIALKMDVGVDVVSGYNKKLKQNIIAITSDNPYVRPIAVKSYRIDMPKPKRYGIGVFAGYGMTKNGLSPQVGVGIGYIPIRF